jgi:hypothetical protein
VLAGAPGVVEELAALRRAWVVDTDTDTDTDTGAGWRRVPDAWHDQWLWPCLNPVKAGHYPAGPTVPSPTGSSSDPDHRQHIGGAR